MTYDNDFREDSVPAKRGRRRGPSKFRKGKRTVQCPGCRAWFFTQAGQQHHAAHHCPVPS